ncbi:hypothetical protein LB524_24365 [Mesorhizobium sp. ESP6-5]|uniref:hypothetical protein n=1 Tax=Mesorhizobium sp. ESP6-5 TaxID=2876623 RepID=UPI001CC9CDE8|nr:hypothetical protein [Mesorhizobium sp. ESP6-5]MBZ9758427.1 hypothetical protein [Mesorhizobium sp. ESP6-5]
MSYQLFPTAPQSGTAILYSPASGYISAHNADIAYFSKPGRKSRTLAIRRCDQSEFRVAGEPIDAPAGWALIVRLSSNTHIVIFLYRGENFFALERGYAGVLSDADIAAIAIECFRRSGVDGEELAKFLAGSR